MEGWRREKGEQWPKTKKDEDALSENGKKKYQVTVDESLFRILNKHFCVQNSNIIIFQTQAEIIISTDLKTK